MKLKNGNKYKFFSPIRNKWVISTVVYEEIYGYLCENVYVLHNIDGPAWTSISINDPVYFLHGVKFEYENYLREKKIILREQKLKRILNNEFYHNNLPTL